MDIPFGRSIVGSFTAPGGGKVAEPPTQEQACTHTGYVIVNNDGKRPLYLWQEPKRVAYRWVLLGAATVFPRVAEAHSFRHHLSVHCEIITFSYAEKKEQGRKKP